MACLSHSDRVNSLKSGTIAPFARHGARAWVFPARALIAVAAGPAVPVGQVAAAAAAVAAARLAAELPTGRLSQSTYWPTSPLRQSPLRRRLEEMSAWS